MHDNVDPSEIVEKPFEGDGIQVSVHASEDDFQDSDEEEAVGGSQSPPGSQSVQVEETVTTPHKQVISPVRPPMRDDVLVASGSTPLAHQWQQDPDLKRIMNEMV